jgi:hypothetical protein
MFLANDLDQRNAKISPVAIGAPTGLERPSRPFSMEHHWVQKAIIDIANAERY